VLRRHIVEPSHMTWHESPDLGLHAGFVSTVADASLFVSALQRNQLKDLQRRSVAILANPRVKIGRTSCFFSAVASWRHPAR
jgi:hypothetical protein